ncbi:hypothetical protein KG892_00810 [Vermiphilus pyriformis]|jgi:chromosome segregation ATPase|uniref:Uncharacterized protein n=1 Tax=candidate division TM6 bacterium JCVI TM6SC1 TaxID=1306947 RepID=A0A0D2GNQ2_9BACT|nr:hypothetical protein J120_03705 [candidate division TM6 bacterium JCVI TM6SC1]UNE35552.1 MAG: hypothetical protein KG892_00810 [Vermiphilus pyriformis]
MLKVLEEKIAALIGIVSNLRTENSYLLQEKMDLSLQLEQAQIQIQALEKALKEDAVRVEQLDEERLLTNLLVGDIIKNIDTLVQHEQ